MSLLRAVSVSGGKDSTACALLALERHAADEVRFVFADTGNEHEATYEYVTEYLPKMTGIPVTVVRADFSEDIERTRARLERFAAGEEDTRGKARWTPERAKAALEVLHPTGNPFLDLCLFKGMFPTRSRQFCTERLKMEPMMEWTVGLLDDGYEVESWQGVRRDESPRRANLPEREDRGGGYTIYRPILDWTAQQAIDFALSKGLRVNDLYLQGMKRVGCMPCINASKGEVNEIAGRFPEVIARIHEWESAVSEAAKRGESSFFPNPDREAHLNKRGIINIVDWSKTTRGGKQYSLLVEDELPSCSSAYGLCE